MLIMIPKEWIGGLIKSNSKLSNINPISIINVGTFIEYFDLYLYIHMSILLNLIFFPPCDTRSSAFISALTFSSSYILRPFGALFFGYIGDKYGRKATVIYTTIIMALCSFTIASLPSYSAIGLIAPLVIILCRLLQGFSSTAEIVGARIYTLETTSPPFSYFSTTMVNLWASLGVSFAMMISWIFLFIDTKKSWRVAFYLGTLIAMVGLAARVNLKETPIFCREKLLQRNITVFNIYKNIKVVFYYICIEALSPLCFYIIYIYFGTMLKEKYGLTFIQVINQNFFVSIIEVISILVYARLTLRFYPLNILKIKILLLCLCSFIICLLSESQMSIMSILLIQCALAILKEGVVPAHALFIKSFPVIGRYTYAGISYALARMIMTLITTYGCVFMGLSLGLKGISYFLIVCSLLSLFAVFKFSFLSRTQLNVTPHVVAD